MFYSFASPFADLGSAGVTRSPARPTEGASTFPLDLSSKTPPLSRDLLDHQRALAASMLGFSEWCPSAVMGNAAANPAVPSELKGAPDSETSSLALHNSAFLEQQKQLAAALMFSTCQKLMDPVAMFRARSLQHAFHVNGQASSAFVPPIYPLPTDIWSPHKFEAVTRNDEVHAQAHKVSPPAKACKIEKTFQPWKDDVKLPKKKTPFNIEALSKPDDSKTVAANATPKDDAREFKFSLHPKKRRLASPDVCGESTTSFKPKKRLVQVLQKWEEPSVAGLLASSVIGEQEELLLHRAARTGNLEMVTFCLERCSDLDVNQRGRSHTTALHEAASKGFVAIARTLLEKGADPEAETMAGVRPIHEAAAKGHLELVRLLLSYGAEVKAKTYSGDTASSIAAMFDFKALRKLVDDFADDNTFVDEDDAEKENLINRCPWNFTNIATCIDKKMTESGYDALQGAPEFSVVPEIAIRTFRVLRPLADGNVHSLTCAHLDELIASTGLTDVDVFLRTIGDEISNQIVFSVDRTMETDAFSKYYGQLRSVRAIRWDEESKRLLSQALSRGQEQRPGTSAT